MNDDESEIRRIAMDLAEARQRFEEEAGLDRAGKSPDQLRIMEADHAVAIAELSRLRRDLTLAQCAYAERRPVRERTSDAS